MQPTTVWPILSQLSRSWLGWSTYRLCTAGFTLIELIVVITIILLMVGGGITSFVRFNDRQIMVGASKEVLGLLRAAQLKASAGEKPDACDQLLGYSVKGTINQSAVVLSAECNNGSHRREPDLTLPVGVVPSNSFSIVFRTLAGGVTREGVAALKSNTTDYYVISVANGGEIMDIGFTDEIQNYVVTAASPSPSSASPSPSPSPSDEIILPGPGGRSNSPSPSDEIAPGSE